MDVRKSITSFETIDITSPEFYNMLQEQIDFDLARLKKSVDTVRHLRISAAEMEVETAALFHAELWREIEDLKFTVESPDNVNK